MKTVKKTSCPVCKQVLKTIKTGDYNRCDNCFSQYVTSIPSSPAINKRIDVWGNDFVKTAAAEEVSLTNLERVHFLKKYRSRGTLIDIGCGSGIFLRCVKQAHYEVSGMDKSKAIVKHIMSLNIPAYTSLKKIKSNSFDIATCFDIIEHTVDPQIFLADIKRVIKNESLLMITTPNASGISASLLGKRWWVFGPKDHYVLFNPQSLQWLLKKVGFSILDVKTDTITQWFHLNNEYANKLLNKIVYLALLPLKQFIFAKNLGDNIQIIAQLT